LHYVKDVTFNEDKLKIKKGNTPKIFSLIKNIAINAFKNANYTLITSAIGKLLKLL